MMQEGLFYELGIRIPGVELRRDAGLKPGEWQAHINDSRLPIFIGLNEREFMVNDTTERLALLDIKARAAVNPANGNDCGIVEETGGLAEQCKKSGLTTWDVDGYAVLALSAQVRRHASALMVLDSIERDLELLKSSFPELVACARERFEIDQLAQIFRYLLEEEISLRDLRGVLEALLAVKTTIAQDLSKYIVFTPYVTLPCPAKGVTDVKKLTPSHYGECIRMRQKRYISHKYTRGGGSLVVYLIDPALEARVIESTDRPLTDDERSKIIEAFFEEIGSLPQATQNPVILTTLEARRALRELIHLEFPHLAVLSYQELSPDMNIQPIARITLQN
jgi:type III secretion protein V